MDIGPRSFPITNITKYNLQHINYNVKLSGSFIEIKLWEELEVWQRFSETNPAERVRKHEILRNRFR